MYYAGGSLVTWLIPWPSLAIKEDSQADHECQQGQDHPGTEGHGNKAKGDLVLPFLHGDDPEKAIAAQNGHPLTIHPCPPSRIKDLA